MGKDVKISRRQLLALTGQGSLLASPLVQLIGSLAQGMVNKVVAAEAGVQARNLIRINQGGGPPRWMFDLLLTPYEASTNFKVGNNSVGTRLVGGSRYTDIAYETTNIGGLNFPIVWKSQVPKSDGGWRPMADLIPHFFSIRGYHIADNSHGGASRLRNIPTGADRSILAVAGDCSQLPFAAVSRSSESYVSPSGRSAVSFGRTGNHIAQVMRPFAKIDDSRFFNANFITREKLVKGAINESLIAIANYSRGQHPGAKAVSRDVASAYNMVSSSFGDLEAIWTTLVAKYEDLVKRAINPRLSPIEGVTDRPVGALSGRDEIYLNNYSMINQPDLRDLIGPETTIYQLAEYFALAEFIITNRLSNAVFLSPGDMRNLVDANGLISANADEHGTGCLVSVFINTLKARAYTACILELSDRLKEKGMFEDTVFDLGGEFGRGAGRRGSSHANYASSLSLFSGLVKEPLVLGNIYPDRLNRDSSTFGVAAPVSGLGRTLEASDYASTIAHMLGGTNPVRLRNSLVQIREGTIVPTIERAKMIQR